MIILLLFLLVLPSSTNYKLRDFGFGAGGEGNLTSPNYSIQGIAGEVSENKLSGTNYDLGSGLIFTQQANVPAAPTFENTNNYYNKLHFVIDPSNNPNDAKFAIAISDDNFVTTKYVQNDNTIGTELGSEDYQTYTEWGGASGEFVIGLKPSTTYKIRVKAMQGKFTETDYGPIATAATINPSLTFDIDVSAEDTETNPPFSTDFGDLLADIVTSSPEKIWVDFATNGELGGRVYVVAQNSGLFSTDASYTITSVTGNLSSLSEGVGAQGDSVTQTSGGPLTVNFPYDGAEDSVGIIDITFREIFTSTSPLVGGRASFLLKAKSSNVTPSASDYTETLTVIASATF